MSPIGAARVILVVEDEPLVRDVIAHALRDAGWVVLESCSVEAAIALLQTGCRIDVVFTDIQLAGHLSGWDVAEAFHVARSDFPIVYTSGNSVDRSRRVHSSVFFDKPYQPDAIIEAVTDSLAQVSNQSHSDKFPFSCGRRTKGLTGPRVRQLLAQCVSWSEPPVKVGSCG